MKDKTAKFILLIFISLVFTGCLPNIFSSQGPSWEAPLRLPIIYRIPSAIDILNEQGANVEEDGHILAVNINQTEYFSFADLDINLANMHVHVEEAPSPIPTTEETFKETFEFTEADIDEITFASVKILLTTDDANITNAKLTKIDESNQAFTNDTLAISEQLTIEKNEELEVQLTVDDYSGQEINIIISFADASDITQVTGNIEEELQVNRSFATNFELPDEFQQVEFTDVSLDVEVASSIANLPLDFSNLVIKAGNKELVFTSGQTITGEGTLEFTSESILELINSHPDSLGISGYITVGDGSNVTLLLDSSSITLELNMQVNLSFIINDEIVHTTDSYQVEPTDEQIEGLKDVLSTVYGRAIIENNLPLGAEIIIKLSSQEDVFADPQALNLTEEPLTITKGVTDDDGIVTEKQHTDLSFSITNEARDLLIEGSYVQMQIKIPTGQTSITFTNNDYISIEAWIELLVKINS